MRVQMVNGLRRAQTGTKASQRVIPVDSWQEWHIIDTFGFAQYQS
jgi:hypothetical protein